MANRVVNNTNKYIHSSFVKLQRLYDDDDGDDKPMTEDQVKFPTIQYGHQ